jgi:hypothetical protein
MLGIARASEYAGWWTAKLSQVAFSSTSTLTPTIRRVNSYSYATRDANSGQFGISGISPTGSLNLASLTGYTGYNQLRSVNVAHFYPNSSTWTGYGNGTYSTVRQQFTNSAGTTANQFDINLQVSGTNLIINGYNNAYQLPSAVSTYYNKWMTVVVATAETSSVFTSWSGPTVTDMALRIAVYNTLTGALIGKSDAAVSSSQMPGNWATQYGTTLSVAQSFAANSYYYFCYGIGADTDTNNPLTPIGGLWFCWGTMFDPLSATDTSWRTAAPANQIGNAIPFLQSQFTGYNTTGSPASAAYNNSPAGISLYSQSANTNWYSSPGSTNLAQMYSNTILIGNN